MELNRKPSDKALKKEEEQLSLSLNHPLRNILWKYRGIISRHFFFLESVRFFKSEMVWVLIIVAISTLLLLINYYMAIYPNLPEMIPLFENYLALEQRLVNRNFLYLLITGVVVAIAVVIFLSYKLYNRKHYMSYFILLTMNLLLINFTINMIKLFSNYI